MAVALHHSLTNTQPFARPARGLVERARDGLARLVVLWLERHADLRAIERMSERDLRDIRATRWELRRELSRPFWRG
ncbi:MAG: hypothetical protein JSR21_14690 [Proteobacteria bacterium]|nr:hypothetical protein [Pseudomonadota bacterium]